MEVKQTAESTNNHQTFTTRPILNQRFVEIEGVLTSESPNTKTEVVPTAESPTPRISRDEQEIRRNARNPSGNMEMREMRANLTLYHPQKSILNKPEK